MPCPEQSVVAQKVHSVLHVSVVEGEERPEDAHMEEETDERETPEEVVVLATHCKG